MTLGRARRLRPVRRGALQLRTRHSNVSQYPASRSGDSQLNPSTAIDTMTAPSIAGGFGDAGPTLDAAAPPPNLDRRRGGVLRADVG